MTDVYRSLKEQDTETADYSELAGRFDSDDFDAGYMAAYNAILPYAKTFAVRLDGKPYLVEECYCLKKKCPCTATTLAFYPVTENEGRANEVAGAAVFSLRVDYSSKSWSANENDELRLAKDDIEQVRSAFESQQQDCYATMMEHQQRLKLLYSNYLKTVVTEKKPKIGRNDPCACGSGKKYKKCCGR